MRKIIPCLVLIPFTLILVSCNQKLLQKGDNVIEYVDPFIGTGFHGHTFPGATLPHGKVQLSPDTHLMGWDASSGYHYNDSLLYGFSHTHLSGTGIGDMGDILVLPYTHEISDKPTFKLSHENEIATPGYYSIYLEEDDIKCELTASKRIGWHKYTYPKNRDAKLMIDLSHILQSDWGHEVKNSFISIVDDKTVEGYRLTSGWAKNDPIYFRIEFSYPIKEYILKGDNKKNGYRRIEGINTHACFNFGQIENPIEFKVSISHVDLDGAKVNMQEIPSTFTFDQILKQAQSIWNDELGRISIKTEDEEVLKTFYTALYHTKIAPYIFNDADGRYLTTRNVEKKVTGVNKYSVYSLWDVFRAWYPLMTIIEPERAREWVYDLYDHYQEGNILPKWSLNRNYTGCMVGYPAVSLMAEAVNKNLIDSIATDLLLACVKSSQWNPRVYNIYDESIASLLMPKHIYYKNNFGFVPCDKISESVSYGLEMAYYDWCIAQMSKQLHHSSLHQSYLNKSGLYTQYFDFQTKFMRGKKQDYSWNDNFDERFSDHMKSDYTEGNAYQWTPFVIHDIDGLINLMGGKKEFGEWLDELFTTSSDICGENASGDITGLIGQYAHGNEPSHHIAYLYRYTDRPWRTDDIVDTILYDFYNSSPSGIIGNEDCGQMSAWYVLSSLGFYPVNPASGVYVIGRPIVDEAIVQVQHGELNIKVVNQGRKNKYVQKVTFNNKEIINYEITHEELSRGGELVIHLGSAF